MADYQLSLTAQEIEELLNMVKNGAGHPVVELTVNDFDSSSTEVTNQEIIEALNKNFDSLTPILFKADLGVTKAGIILNPMYKYFDDSDEHQEYFVAQMGEQTVGIVSLRVGGFDSQRTWRILMG